MRSFNFKAKKVETAGSKVELIRVTSEEELEKVVHFLKGLCVQTYAYYTKHNPNSNSFASEEEFERYVVDEASRDSAQVVVLL
jgi:hypothetical protein